MVAPTRLTLLLSLIAASASALHTPYVQHTHAHELPRHAQSPGKQPQAETPRVPGAGLNHRRRAAFQAVGLGLAAGLTAAPVCAMLPICDGEVTSNCRRPYKFSNMGLAAKYASKKTARGEQSRARIAAREAKVARAQGK